MFAEASRKSWASLCLKEAGQLDKECPLLSITPMEPKLSEALLVILGVDMDVPSADWTETRAAPFYSGLTYISFLRLPPQSTAVWTLEGDTRKSWFILLLPGSEVSLCWTARRTSSRVSAEQQWSTEPSTGKAL